jgi:hypothetical protein
MLHDPEAYPDPHEYKPERFLRMDADGVYELDPSVLDPRTIAFGFGRRCVDCSASRVSLADFCQDLPGPARGGEHALGGGSVAAGCFRHCAGQGCKRQAGAAKHRVDIRHPVRTASVRIRDYSAHGEGASAHRGGGGGGGPLCLMSCGMCLSIRLIRGDETLNLFRLKQDVILGIFGSFHAALHPLFASCHGLWEYRGASHRYTSTRISLPHPCLSRSQLSEGSYVVLPGDVSADFYWRRPSNSRDSHASTCDRVDPT